MLKREGVRRTASIRERAMKRAAEAKAKADAVRTSVKEQQAGAAKATAKVGSVISAGAPTPTQPRTAIPSTSNGELSSSIRNQASAGAPSGVAELPV